jgi:hypothetical protein
MKTKNTFFRLLILLGCVFTFFIGCSDDPDDTDDVNYGVGSPKTFPAEVSGTDLIYYSLSTGTVVTNPASQDWDIAVGGALMEIYTNSGVTATAAGSNGNGGVKYTDKTDFGNVSDADGVTCTGEYAGLDVDAKRYVDGGDEEDATAMNVMIYAGFDMGTGTADDPYQYVPYPGYNTPAAATYLPNTNDKKQAVTMTHMSNPTSFETSDQVYIITHGTGNKKSKIQVTDFSYSSRTSYSYEITYQNFQ